MRKKTHLIRAHDDFKKVVNMVRARYLMDGKTPPTTAKITKVIAKNVDAEKILGKDLIRL